jgi:hypothetical protein
MTNRDEHATETQIRNLYRDMGKEVRISRTGHVEFREPGGKWLEGRYVDEYRVGAEHGETYLR